MGLGKKHVAFFLLRVIPICLLLCNAFECFAHVLLRGVPFSYSSLVVALIVSEPQMSSKCCCRKAAAASRVGFCNSLDGRRPANPHTALVTWYASASVQIELCKSSTECPLSGKVGDQSILCRIAWVSARLSTLQPNNTCLQGRGTKV
jgi:hypothetical protein